MGGVSDGPRSCIAVVCLVLFGCGGNAPTPKDNAGVGHWRAMTEGGPSARSLTVGVKAGASLIVWGGSPDSGDGASYEPNQGTWTPIAASPLAPARWLHVGVWTGQKLLVWGGWCGRLFSPCAGGAAFDPSTGEWEAVDTAAAPQSRGMTTAVWTGHEMLIWGGVNGDRAVINSAGAYDPVAKKWREVNTVDAPTPRRYHSSIWTGTEMIVWGGDDSPQSFHALGDGARYDPATNKWSPMSQVGAPSARYAHTATWTGREMVVWGGAGCGAGPRGPIYCGDGARYDPITDKWSAMTTVGAPAARVGHTSVWSGNLILIWGGASPDCGSGAGHCADGAIYDPAADTWQPMSGVGAPAERASHVAIWADDRMLVWGGVTGHQGFPVGDGGEFFP
jgi:N-acetylneuraminic acid mutarotase